MIKFKFNIFVVLVFTVFPLQNSAQAQLTDTIKTDVIHFFNSGAEMLESAGDLTSLKALRLAGSAALISAGYVFDNNVKNLAHRNAAQFYDNSFSVDAVYGSPYTPAILGTLYGAGLFLKEPGLRRVSLQTLEAITYSGLITSLIKTVVGRSRPFTEQGKFDFDPVSFNFSNTSFPSGHTTIAFAVSSVLANNTDLLFLKILSYSGAGIVGMARIYNNAHWLSDVLAGGLIGWFVGDFVSTYELTYAEKRSAVTFVPYINSNSLGVLVSF